MPIVLNIDAIAAGDRAEVWHDSCARTSVGVDVRAVAEEPIGAASAPSIYATWSSA